MYRFLRFALLAVCLCLSSCATAPTAAPVAAAPKAKALPILRIGVSRTAPPIIFERRDVTMGLEAEFAEELAKALGRNYRFVPTFWPNLIPELRGRRIDIVMSGMTVTPERDEVIAFAEPYMTIGLKALIRAKDSDTLSSLEAILKTDKRIGVETGTTAEAFAREHIPQARRYPIATLRESMQALRDERVDIVINDSPTILMMADQYKDIGLVAVPGRFTEDSLAWAVNRFNHELLDQVNEVLRQWKQSGKLDEMIAKWVPKE